MEPDVLLAGQVHIEAWILEDNAYTLAHGGWVSGDIYACDTHAASGGREDGGEDGDRRGFARSIGAEQREEAASLHRILLRSPIALDQPLDCNHIHSVTLAPLGRSTAFIRRAPAVAQTPAYSAGRQIAGAAPSIQRPRTDTHTG